MEIQALGYVGVGAADLTDWSDFATRWLGMQMVERGNSVRAFRMDDRKQRLVVDRSLADGERYFGWEVADAAALDALAARLEAAGVAVRREPGTLAEARCVREVISFADPAGNRLEAFHGAALADDKFQPGRAISGFRTGPLGMGHAVFHVKNIDDLMGFYHDVLGFGISDYILTPFRAFFLHVNPRHHSVALIETGKQDLHHLMVELYSLDDVGQGYDIALGEPDRVAVTLGRHSNDLMTSFYMRTPSPILIECGWGGREVDDATATPLEMTTVGSYWGHRGLFQTLGGEASAEQGPPRMPPPGGRRAPLQVIDGNYQRMDGVCPWWDQMRDGPSDPK